MTDVARPPILRRKFNKTNELTIELNVSYYLSLLAVNTQAGALRYYLALGEVQHVNGNFGHFFAIVSKNKIC